MMKFCFKFLECGYFLFLTCLSVWCKDDILFRLVDYCTFSATKKAQLVICLSKIEFLDLFI